MLKYPLLKRGVFMNDTKLLFKLMEDGYRERRKRNY